MDYKISVVIPTYNCYDSLIALVDSIKQQTIGFSNIEFLIIDDNSTNKDTLNLIQRYNDSLDNCTAVFFDKNYNFPGTGRNKGLEIAKGEFIIFSDHDDTYQKDAFEVLYNKAVENNADMTFSNYYKVFSDKKVPLKTQFNGNVVITDISEDERLFTLSPSIWTKLFKREFLLKNNIRFLEGMLAEDLYVFIFALLASSKTVYLDDFYAYNYSIRDSKLDKSTIHLRTKKILDNMINGYYETYSLLVKSSKEEYFYMVFKNHFIYWINSLMISKIPDSDKIVLLEKINPLLVKYLSINGSFGVKLYDCLVNSILSQNYKKVLKIFRYLKVMRIISDLIKK